MAKLSEDEAMANISVRDYSVAQNGGLFCARCPEVEDVCPRSHSGEPIVPDDGFQQVIPQKKQGRDS